MYQGSSGTQSTYDRAFFNSSLKYCNSNLVHPAKFLVAQRVSYSNLHLNNGRSSNSETLSGIFLQSRRVEQNFHVEANPQSSTLVRYWCPKLRNSAEFWMWTTQCINYCYEDCILHDIHNLPTEKLKHSMNPSDMHFSCQESFYMDPMGITTFEYSSEVTPGAILEGYLSPNIYVLSCAKTQVIERGIQKVHYTNIHKLSSIPLWYTQQHDTYMT